MPDDENRTYTELLPANFSLLDMLEEEELEEPNEVEISTPSRHVSII